jgi:hypothetical protein
MYYLNTTTSVITTNSQTFTVPDGFYNAATLATVLNSLFLAANINSLATTQLACTFGGNTVDLTGITYVYQQNYSFNLYSSVLNQDINLGLLQYQRLELVIDSDTSGLLKALGVIYQTIQDVYQQSLIINCIANYGSFGIQDLVYYTFMTNYNNTFAVTMDNTIPTATIEVFTNYYLDLVQITNLFIILDNSISQHRNSYDGLKQSDYILGIPVNSAFDQVIIYNDTGQTVKSYNTNLHLTTIHLQIKDQLGRFVDFRGTPWNMQILFEFYDNIDGTAMGNAAEMTMQKIPNFNVNAVARPYGTVNSDLLFPDPTTLGLGKKRKGL